QLWHATMTSCASSLSKSA
ncbi:hypothetical protein D044_0252B, partial [Vibrio parahaemolyticus EKP-026]